MSKIRLRNASCRGLLHTPELHKSQLIIKIKIIYKLGGATFRTYYIVSEPSMPLLRFQPTPVPNAPSFTHHPHHRLDLAPRV